MKSTRHAKIIEIISNNEIETQDELAYRLNEQGFEVTQATISRDIRELKLSKVTTSKGKQVYAVMGNHTSNMASKYSRVFKDGYISSALAESLVVIHTVSGMAMAVATAIDGIKIPGIVGCIAGDDTVFCAISGDTDRDKVLSSIKRIVNEVKQ